MPVIHKLFCLSLTTEQDNFTNPTKDMPSYFKAASFSVTMLKARLN